MIEETMNTTSMRDINKPLSTAEAAEWLGVSRRTLLELAKHGKMPRAIKRGSLWYFPYRGLLEFLKIDDDAKQ